MRSDLILNIFGSIFHENDPFLGTKNLPNFEVGAFLFFPYFKMFYRVWLTLEHIKNLGRLSNFYNDISMYLFWPFKLFPEPDLKKLPSKPIFV